MAGELQALLKEINRTVRSDKIMRTALTTVLAVHKARIHNQGKDSTGNKIGTYSTKPISIAKSKQARNTGKTHFKGGYSEYKSAIGKNPGFVNLIDKGQMQSDYGLIVSGDNYGFGFQNSENFNKTQWLQDKYQKLIYGLSDQEANLLAETLKAQVEGQLNR